MKLTYILFLLLEILSLIHCHKEQKITITGSETMHSMMLLLANNFSKENKNYIIDVKGGGSSEGINELIGGLTDIALSSRDLTEAEFEKLNSKQTLESLVIAYDGAAFVVHPTNSVESLTLEQLSDIFSGKIKNWKEVGGANQPITVVIRDNYSGTAHYIREHVVRQLDLGQASYFKNKQKDYTSEAVTLINNEEISDFVNKNPNAIAYMGMGIAHIKSNLKLLKYSRTSSDEAILPTIKSITERKYKLSRALKIFYRTDRSGSKIDEFIKYILSENGQKGVLQSGYLRSTLPEVEVSAQKK
ncbi:MAG TPA: phosphate ABC transporter substrate-binding protein [Leptospiraceae bacterium]|nr:phosphate ABC transporter substrate-binding protein [Leptospiraceae bacterium]HMW04543.1 phosphate ABC transporter substrate-binding protein [Leptospiraceae bacterium]HMX34340.1 phosphate ABC transporter substrate-binding protein [Leptospiraceae bacterium]HMY30729.1 phosphate ABC transporter substrate-binding protein [Leptospiraceae bacterium]HMZ64307.1 phosphate ABC transporter substrate-binding protein [Leptospiraceae bacterium]